MARRNFLILHENFPSWIAGRAGTCFSRAGLARPAVRNSGLSKRPAFKAFNGAPCRPWLPFSQVIGR